VREIATSATKDSMWQRAWWHTVKAPGTLAIENVSELEQWIVIYLSMPRNKTEKIRDQIRSNDNRFMGQETPRKVTLLRGQNERAIHTAAPLHLTNWKTAASRIPKPTGGPI